MKKKSILIVMAILSIILVGVIAINSIYSNEQTDSGYSQLSSSEKDFSSNTDSSSKVEESSSKTDSSSKVEESSSVTESSSTGDTEIAQTMATFNTLSYYKQENEERYIDYKELNDDLSYEECIVNVNIGLDNPFYTNTYMAKDPTAIDVLVNKYSGLEIGYVPPDLVNIPAEFDNRGGSSKLREVACNAFVKMCQDAKKEGFTIKGQSAYRSGEYQQGLYNRYVAQDGKEEADRYSARPGFSEHQTGLVIDIIGSQYGSITSFGKEKEYPYVKDNAHKYGFIIRYEEENTHITGYKKEEWHLRYLGVELATKLYNEKLTLEEYYALHK